MTTPNSCEILLPSHRLKKWGEFYHNYPQELFNCISMSPTPHARVFAWNHLWISMQLRVAIGFQTNESACTRQAKVAAHKSPFFLFQFCVMLHAQVTISVSSQIWQYSECESRNSYTPFHIVGCFWWFSGGDFFVAKKKGICNRYSFSKIFFTWKNRRPHKSSDFFSILWSSLKSSISIYLARFGDI